MSGANRHRLRLALLGGAALAGGCGGSARAPLPLRPETVPYADTLPIREPAARDPLEAPKVLDDALAGEVSRVISVRRAIGADHEALNVTRFDDVVPSAWFEHRNAARRLEPGEIFRGPTASEGPDTTGTLEIISAKVQGISPGFNIRDRRGDRYVVKFDPKGFPHLSSAAGVISNRLLYAAGYHVPEDYVFVFSKQKLAVAEGATIRGEDFAERPLTLDVALEVLALTDTLPDGRYLAVASKFVPGPPKGPFFFEGVREDDPNDHFHHEYRRELRGLYVVSSWINHVDMRWMNTMDAYVSPGYLRHYLIDFAASLGSGTIRPHEPREGTEYNLDFWDSVSRIFTLGFYRVGWEDRSWEVIDPSIGWLEAERFEPASWKPNWPNAAFRAMTARDAYWGAKLVGSFSDAQVRAAVEAGRLPARRAVDTLTNILASRRDRILAWWYARVSPLEELAIETGRTTGIGFDLRFVDLGVEAGLWDADRVTYAWELEHDALDRRWHGTGSAVSHPADPPSTRRLRIEPDDPERRGTSGHGPGGLARLRLSVVREDGARQPPATAWLRWDTNAGGYVVVGLEH